jgi:CheY-like chemotaxis protein
VVLPSTPVWVDADPVRLSQVFNNLLNNACKFTESPGVVSITAEVAGGDAVVVVKDTGIGISSENLGSIFEMFEQIDKRLERTRGGLGIGLTLVRRLVELHGGAITAESEGVGRGSQFVVKLPVVQPATNVSPATSQPGKVAAAGAGARRILVTDDNRDAANSLAMLLKLGGHQVATAYDGIEAVQKAQEYKPEVILLDIGLPGMNGYEVCRSIREKPWGKDIRIVAVTGWGQEQDRRNTRDAGFDHHLVKPVTVSALSEVLVTAS